MRLIAPLAEGFLWLLLSPLFLWITLARKPVRRQERFQLSSEFMSIWPFRVGALARRVFYQQTLAHCGLNPVIRMGTVFVYPEATIGDNVFIGNRCVIGLATIGDDVLLSHHVSVLSGRHHHVMTDKMRPVRLQRTEVQRVYIGSNTWLGANAIIMADVGDNVTIGAGAVVVIPVASNATAVGNPAKVISSQRTVISDES